jgi:hypothetical protein
MNITFVLAGDPKGLWLYHGPSQFPQLSQITLWLDKFYEWKCKQLKTYPSKVILVTLVVKTTTPPSFMFPLFLDTKQVKHTLLILPCSTSNSSSHLIIWKSILTIESILMKFSTLSRQSLTHPQGKALYQPLLYYYMKHNFKANDLWYTT